MTPEEIDEWARRLAEARRDRVGCEPISESNDLTLADAYAIQRAGTARRLARGERIVGWKLGYTSLAMREQMGVDAPNFGPLTDVMILDDGATVDPNLLQPRVEPEIALRFARPLEGAVSVEDVLDATASAHACLEVVDSVYPAYRFRLEDNTADGSSAAQVVIGPALSSTSRLDDVSVSLRHNLDEVAAAFGREASGHPAVGVVWLVAQLAERALRIEPGDVVITGGLTRAVPLAPGDVVDAVYDGEVSVSVRRTVSP